MAELSKRVTIMTNHELTIAVVMLLKGIGDIQKRLDKLETQKQVLDDN